MVPVAPLSPSPRFVTALAANLQAWHGRTARLQTDEAIQRLNPEFPNLLRAIEMGLVLPQTQTTTAEVIIHCFHWVQKTSRVAAWQPLLERTLERLPETAVALRVKLLSQLSQFQRTQAQWQTAVATAQRAMPLLPHLPENEELTAEIHLILGQAYLAGRDYTLAREHANEAFGWVRHYSPHHILLIELLGMLAHHEGQHEEACHYYQQAIALQQQTGYTTYHHRTLNQLILALQAREEWAEAHTISHQLIAHLRQTDYVLELAQALLNQGAAYYGQADLANAAERFAEAELLLQPVPREFELKGVLNNNLACVWRDRGEWALAEQFYQRSLAAYEQMGDVLRAAQVWGNMGKLFLRQNLPELARSRLVQALRLLEPLRHNKNAQALYKEYKKLLDGL
ncbi:MAG: tetratricopeptide repeat protein [Chloroflexi bacterium]|nr:tetratricopeptide repeat protein [Chloroflexota bacterium]